MFKLFKCFNYTLTIAIEICTLNLEDDKKLFRLKITYDPNF